MKIVADTNVLIRSIVQDEPQQSEAAAEALKAATSIAVATPTLCEFVWVLNRVYRMDRTDIAAAIRALLEVDKVVADRPAAEAGLAMLDAGGDFADGVIAQNGYHLGGEIFVSFDRRAVATLDRLGQPARLLEA